MGMHLGNGGLTRSDINMTPMIDILLVLIIIFMVITPIAPRGLQTQIPQQAVPPPEQRFPSGDIVITVRSGGSILINHDPVELASLEPRLSHIFGSHTNAPVFVRGEKGLEFRQVAQVIEIAKGVGITRVGLMTE